MDMKKLIVLIVFAVVIGSCEYDPHDVANVTVNPTVLYEAQDMARDTTYSEGDIFLVTDGASHYYFVKKEEAVLISEYKTFDAGDNVALVFFLIAGIFLIILIIAND